MEDYQKFRAPTPVVNQKEAASLDALTARYNKLITPSRVAKIGMKAGELIPEKVKLLGGELAETISAQELYKQSMEWVANGFKVIEEHAAKFQLVKRQLLKK